VPLLSFFPLILGDPQPHDRLLSTTSSTAHVPANLLGRELEIGLFVARERGALVEAALAALHYLGDAVLLALRVAGAPALHHLGDRGVDGHVVRRKGYVGAAGHAPGRDGTLQDVYLGVLGGEVVVVAGLAAHAAGRVLHVEGGSIAADHGVGGGESRWVLGEDRDGVLVAVGRHGIDRTDSAGRTGNVLTKAVGHTCHGKAIISTCGITWDRHAWEPTITSKRAAMRSIAIVKTGTGVPATTNVDSHLVRV
jgi:hypothetical protein